MSDQGIGAKGIRQGHAAFNDRDRDALFEVIAEDVTWHAPGNSPAAGTHEGRDAVWENFFAPIWDAPVRVEDHDIADTGEHVIAIADLVFDLGDSTRSWRVVEVAHYDDDGRATERWGFTDDQADLDAFIEQMAGQQ